MINNNAMTDDKTAVDRWENEGGRTSPPAAFYASLRPMALRTKNDSIHMRVIGDHQRLEQSRIFSRSSSL
jgi:hypothetical protein